jgi:hypothetical protein
MSPDAKRDSWDKLSIILQPLGGLFTALAIAAFGYFSSDYLNRRQAVETTRKYTKLMSRREESRARSARTCSSRSSHRFCACRERPRRRRPESRAARLQLPRVLNLKPLFFDLKRRIAKSTATASSASTRAELRDYQDRLERVAREIARKQMIVLEGGGKKIDRTIDLSQDPDGTTLEPATVTLDGVETALSIDVLSVNRKERTIGIGLTLETPDPEQGRQTKTASFEVSYFDFPMIDNTRLAHGQRCAVVLNSFSDQSADVTLVLFPGEYAGLKEKPYYNEVIDNVLSASKKLGQK